MEKSIKSFNDLVRLKSLGKNTFTNYVSNFRCHLTKNERVELSLHNKKGIKRIISRYAYNHCNFFGQIFKVYHSLKGIKLQIDYYSDGGFYKLSPDSFLPVIRESNILSSSEFIFSELERLIEIEKKLYDSKSKVVFFNLLLSRLFLCPKFLLDTSEDPENQYFDCIDFEQEKNLVLIDGGAFDGQTSLDMIIKFRDVREIYIFEPNKNNFYKTVKKLDKVNGLKLNFFSKGLSNETKKVSFLNQGSASSIHYSKDDLHNKNSNLDEIDTIRIDDLGLKRIDFIKLDIEGEELNAIKGAENTILKHKPKLAICIYHKLSDYITLVEYISSMNLDYKFHIRHYNKAMPYETVLYCV